MAGAARVGPRLQRAEVVVVVQSGLWPEGVVAEDPLDLGLGDPGGWVGVGHLPKVQGAGDQNDPYWPPQPGVWGAGFLLLGMVVGVVAAAPGVSSPAAQPLSRPGPR